MNLCWERFKSSLQQELFFFFSFYSYNFWIIAFLPFLTFSTARTGMNSNAVCGLNESNPSDTKCLDVTLLPQNISDGMLLNPKEYFTVEWNHERNKVPDLLESHGVPLELWQKWFDQVNSLWMERIESLVSNHMTVWSKYSWILFPVSCLLLYVVMLLVPTGDASSWTNKLQLVSIFILAASPFIFLFCFVIHIRKIYKSLVYKIIDTEEEIEKAWSDFVSDLNARKCEQLGLHVKTLRYHLDMLESDNKFYVPFGIQFSALSEGRMTNTDCEGFQCKEKSTMINDSNNTLTSLAYGFSYPSLFSLFFARC